MKLDVSQVVVSILDEFRDSKGFGDPAVLANLVIEKVRPLSVTDATQARAAIGGLLLNPGSATTLTLIFPIVSALLRGRDDRIICDPWAGMGALLALVRQATKAEQAIAIAPTEPELELGKALVNPATWILGDTLDTLSTFTSEFDVVVSIPPFNVRSDRTLTITGQDGEIRELRDSLGNLVLASASTRLSREGLGIFVVPPSFFSFQKSVFKRFPEIGLGVEAAFVLPPGALAPYTNIQTYLIVVRRRLVDHMFVGQLSLDSQSNLQIIENFKSGKADGPLELGRYVASKDFTGLNAIQLVERIDEAKEKFGAPAKRLGDLALRITLGRQTDDFKFPAVDNAIYVPLIGISDVVASEDDFSLKPQNYAQVEIDPSRANARFVVQFLNSELGKEVREMSKVATFIPKLNLATIKSLVIFTPDLELQRELLEIETAINVERNTVMSLQNELLRFEQEIWSTPHAASAVRVRLAKLSNRLSGAVKDHAASDRMQWIETLPFPLASILRAWEATPALDFKTKHNHLLHFFEATAQFLSIIFLSAFSSSESQFSVYRPILTEALRNQNLSFEKASFGLWKVILEYLGKNTRKLLTDNRPLCAEIFSDSTLELPTAICRKELAQILSRTNHLRNDWSGHGGVVGQAEAKLRNEQLIGELEQLRNVFGNFWTRVQLICALQSRFRHGSVENEVKLLTGSNPNFLTEIRSMLIAMDVERIYLGNKGENKALKLIPLIEMGPSPESDINACYFFNRIDRDGVRFISYHYTDQPEFSGPFAETREAIKFLTTGNSDDLILLGLGTPNSN